MQIKITSREQEVIASAICLLMRNTNYYFTMMMVQILFHLLLKFCLVRYKRKVVCNLKLRGVPW